ncbi:MAG: hypothetical protein OXC46_01250 [Thaumarchaeota archaeon]|nr:hypothetical protein [Nitrososphaerota archaeon]
MSTQARYKADKAKKSHTSTFFPRVIREFEDDDEPMVYGNTKSNRR